MMPKKKNEKVKLSKKKNHILWVSALNIQNKYDFYVVTGRCLEKAY